LTGGTTARALARLSLPALVVGVAASLVLLVVSLAAEWVQEVLWKHLPASLGLDGGSGWWTLGMLTAVGLVAGLVVWKIPIGPDPATEGLVGAPLPVRVVPGMLLATGITLAGGVSLGPENPITAANVALAVAVGARLLPGIQVPVWAALGAAGTIGALFGTPVAAALILSEMVLGSKDEPLWDRLFAPLIAAGAGAITTVLVAAPVFDLGLPGYTFRAGDLVSGAVVAVAGVLVGLAAVYAFPYVHTLFHRLPHPVPRLMLGGLVLGVLGVIGGQITLFKGLSELKELVVAHDGAATLAVILAVKMAALLVAATAGFVGGRIFPVVFAGGALGLLVTALVPAVPVSLSIACAVMGVTLAVTQQGWLSLFMAATMVADLDLLPVLCLAVLPAWLLVTGRPQMIIQEST
jgi:H+/Cl- antiporter ClcA